MYWKPYKYNVVIDPSFLHPSNLIKSPRVPLFALLYTEVKSTLGVIDEFLLNIIKNHRENVGYHLVLDEITLGAALCILVNSAATTDMQLF